jgi:hypothetical protein
MNQTPTEQRSHAEDAVFIMAMIILAEMISLADETAGENIFSALGF